MKFLTSGTGIAVLAAVLGLGTTAGLLYVQKAAFLHPAPDAQVLRRPWSFKTEEVDNLIAELKNERAKLDQRESGMDQTAAHIEAERQELEKVKASIQAMRDEIAKEIPELQDAEIKNLKGLSQTYSNLSPQAAVAIFREMDDVTVVKILSLMKPDKAAGVLQEMSHTQEQDDTLAKRAALLTDKLRLLKPLKRQASLP